LGSEVRVMTEQEFDRLDGATIQLANQLSELERLHAFFEEIGDKASWNNKLKFDLVLSCEELLTNTINYGFPQGGNHVITLTVKAEQRRIEVTLEDKGLPFNPLAQEDPDVTLSLEEREVGGLGIFFVRRIMNEVLYERTDTGNRVILRKMLE
jgi:serine/threonine-protein kinase RsbW